MECLLFSNNFGKRWRVCNSTFLKIGTFDPGETRFFILTIWPTVVMLHVTPFSSCPGRNETSS